MSTGVTGKRKQSGEATSKKAKKAKIAQPVASDADSEDHADSKDQNESAGESGSRPAEKKEPLKRFEKFVSPKLSCWGCGREGELLLHVCFSLPEIEFFTLFVCADFSLVFFRPRS